MKTIIQTIPKRIHDYINGLEDCLPYYQIKENWKNLETVYLLGTFKDWRELVLQFLDNETEEVIHRRGNQCMYVQLVTIQQLRKLMKPNWKSLM